MSGCRLRGPLGSAAKQTLVFGDGMQYEDTEAVAELHQYLSTVLMGSSDPLAVTESKRRLESGEVPWVDINPYRQARGSNVKEFLLHRQIIEWGSELGEVDGGEEDEIEDGSDTLEIVGTSLDLPLHAKRRNNLRLPHHHFPSTTTTNSNNNTTITGDLGVDCDLHPVEAEESIVLYGQSLMPTSASGGGDAIGAERARRRTTPSSPPPAGPQAKLGGIVEEVLYQHPPTERGEDVEEELLAYHYDHPRSSTSPEASVHPGGKDNAECVPEDLSVSENIERQADEELLLHFWKTLVAPVLASTSSLSKKQKENGDD